MSNVYLTNVIENTPEESARPHLGAALRVLRAAAATDRRQRHRLVTDPAAADVILFAESHADDTACGPYLDRLRAHPLFRRHRSRCVVFTGLDLVVPLAPGIYPSVTASRAWRPVARSGPYLVERNPYIPHQPLEAVPPDQAWLASFVGCARGKAVRQALMQIRDPRFHLRDNSEAFVAAIRAGRGEEAKYKQEYIDLSRSSLFILCPRGSGPSSIRLFEAMEMGRAPVILADDWLPPHGPDWASCSVRVRERDVGRLPAVLREYEPRAAEMGRAARRAWEEHFGPETLFDWTVEQANDLIGTNRLARSLATGLAWARLLFPPHPRRLWRNRRAARQRSNAEDPLKSAAPGTAR